MSNIRFRGFVSLLLSTTFLVAAMTGIVLWLVHSPQFCGLGKGGWKHIHIFTSLLMLTAAALHLWLNWSVYWSYIWERTTQRFNQKRELAMAVAITLAVVLTGFLGDHGDMMRLASMSLRDIAQQGGKPIEQVVASLKTEGIAVHNPADSLLEIAEHNNASPQAIIVAVCRQVPQRPGPK